MTDLKTPENMLPDEMVGEEELVPADDAIIGRAFKWSLLVFVLMGGAIGLMVWSLNRPEPAVVPVARTFVPPKSIDVPVTPPVIKFTDITAEAGIDFVHVNSAVGEKLLPETMGGGCAFFDYDNDGDQDLLLVNSAPWPRPDPTLASSPYPTHALYQNDGKGKFNNVTKGSGLDVSFYGMGVAVGDYDNDGLVDVFMTAVGSNRLFRNEGNGKFHDVTPSAGVAGEPDSWSSSTAFVDVDNDADLDLFVCRYVIWSREIDFAVNYTLDGKNRAYGPPTNFEGAHCVLYRNNGPVIDSATTFTDISADAGVQVNGVLGKPMGKALGIAPVDADGDGWMDLFVANDTVQRFFFHNQKNGTFKEIGAQNGTAFDRNGNATGAMGVDSARYRNDDSLGFVIGNFANEMSSLMVNRPGNGDGGGGSQFTDEAITEGIGAPSRSRLTFGAFFFDADLDGRLDILHANGHIEDKINTFQPSQRYEQSAQLFWNAGSESPACFVAVESESVGDMAKPIVGRGAAYADIDADGDLDVVLTQIAGRPMLLRNDHDKTRHWLRVKLRGDGTKSNRDAIGAWVECRIGNTVQRRQVMPARSYLSQVELPITFGLGEAVSVDSIQITWADGTVQEVSTSAVVADQTIEIDQVSDDR